MSDNPASMQLVLPKSAVEMIDRLRDKNAVFNSENIYYDRDKAFADAMFIGKELAKRRALENIQEFDDPNQGSQGIQPIPNALDGSSPNFELMPVLPGDAQPEFLPIPNIIDSPAAVPPAAVPMEGQESGSPINIGGQTQDPAQSILQQFVNGLAGDNQSSEPMSGNATIGTPDNGEDQSPYDAAYKQFMRYYPRYEADWSQEDESSRKERSPNSTNESDSSQRESEPNSALQDILPTVKSGCEAMIKLAEIGGDLQKQLAQLMEQKGGRADIPNLGKAPSRTKPELEGIYQNPSYDAFAQAYEAFRNQSSDTSLEPRALRRNP